MEYRIGNSLKLKDIGTMAEGVCPKCSNNVRFHIYKNRKTQLVSTLPILDLSSTYFTVCPKCVCLFTFPELSGKEFEKGKTNAIHVSQFESLKKFK